jgi:hypothetical protein
MYVCVYVCEYMCVCVCVCVCVYVYVYVCVCVCIYMCVYVCVYPVPSNMPHANIPPPSCQIFLYNRFLAHMAGSSTKSMLFLSFQVCYTCICFKCI